jgi:hypothetical protein
MKLEAMSVAEVATPEGFKVRITPSVPVNPNPASVAFGGEDHSENRYT